MYVCMYLCMLITLEQDLRQTDQQDTLWWLVLHHHGPYFQKDFMYAGCSCRKCTIKMMNNIKSQKVAENVLSNFYFFDYFLK